MYVKFRLFLFVRSLMWMGPEDAKSVRNLPSDLSLFQLQTHKASKFRSVFEQKLEAETWTET